MTGSLVSTLQEAARLLRIITLRRLLNAVRLVCSYYVSRLVRRPVVWGMPVRIAVEPTTSCNLRCPECPSGLRSFTRPTGMLQADLYRRVLDELAPDLMYLTLYFQGEPYLHPEFFNLVRYARERRIYTATSTNAHYLDDSRARATVESGLDRLIISVDGTTQETYAAYRIGGNLATVIEGTRRVAEWKRRLGSATPQLIIQFVVFRSNEHQVDEIRRMGRDLGVDDVWIKTAQVYEYEHGNERIPLNERFARYARTDDGRYVIKSKLLNHCWRLWEGAVLTWDGQVVPCCFDKDAVHTLGTVAAGTFASVWRNASYTRFRSQVLRSRSAIDICTNCTEGTTVWT